MNRPLILFAEDDPNDIFFIKRIFKKHLTEYDLITFNNTENVIEFLKNLNPCEIPNLAILDIKLISGYGMEILKFIKTHEKLKIIPTIIMSSSNLKKDKNMAAHYGCDAYIEKIRTYEKLKKELPKIVKQWSKIYKK